MQSKVAKAVQYIRWKIVKRFHKEKEFSIMRTYIRRFPVTTFFVLAFVIDWSLRIGLASLPFFLPKLLAEYAPFIAACVVSGALYGGQGVSALLGRLKQWHAAPRWYLFAIFGPAVVQLSAVWLFALVTGTAFHFRLNLLAQPLMLLIGILLSVGEEVGWRGFAQPHLQRRLGATGAALLIGVLWAIWHIPGDITSWSMLAEGRTYIAFLWFLAGTVTGSLLMAWIYNRTGGNLPLMCILHLTLTLFWSFVDVPTNYTGHFDAFEFSIILMAVATIALYVISWLWQRRGVEGEAPEYASS